MNKIIFDTHLLNSNSDLIPHNLILPPKDSSEEVPEFGLIALPRDQIEYDFTEVFKEFCFSSLLVRPEVIRSLDTITAECNRIQKLEIFNFEDKHIMKIEEYKHI